MCKSPSKKIGYNCSLIFSLLDGEFGKRGSRNIKMIFYRFLVATSMCKEVATQS